MRNVSRSKFLLCFRPVVDIDDVLTKSKDANKNDVKKSYSDIKSEFFQQVPTNISESWIMQHPPKRTLYRVIKSVLFQTMLKTKSGSKNRSPRDSFGSEHSYGSEDSQSILSSPSSHISSASSDSTPSESKSLTKHYSTKEKQKESNHEGLLVKKQKKFKCNGIYMILISLTFTVFCGKFIGIILTLMWVYFFSLLSSSYGYKKKLPKDRCHFRRFAQRKLYHNNN